MTPFEFPSRQYSPFSSRSSEEDPEDLANLLEEEKASSQQFKPERPFYCPIIFHGVLFCLYTTIFFLSLLWIKQDRIHGAGVAHTPARSALKYEPVVFDVPVNITSPYVGEPRAELDEAWHRLLRYTNIRIPAEEMNRLGRLDQGIQLPGGEYFASLMVYHQLHCIKRIHHFIYQEHYIPNATKREKDFNLYHTSHCLDILRQAIQCQGDASLLTMRWGKHQAIPLGNFSMPHECVNWDSLNDWSKNRSFDPFAPGVVVHPVLGPAYPDGKGEPIGVGEDE